MSTLAVQAATITALVALGISALSLTISGASFWTTWLRPGRLWCNIPARVAWVRIPTKDPDAADDQVEGPDASGNDAEEGPVQLAIPLVFYNTGARALVVEDLELHVRKPGQRSMLWNLTRDSTFFRSDEQSDAGRAFHIGGRESVERVAQFANRDGTDPNVDDNSWIPAVVLARLANQSHLEPVSMVLLRRPDRPIGVQSQVVWPNEFQMEQLRTRWRNESEDLRREYREEYERQHAVALSRQSGGEERTPET